MLRRLRSLLLRRGREEPDPLVKVAGMPSRHDAETCLEALRSQGIRAELREDQAGAFEVWARRSQEPQARLVMGLSGRSVIRVRRPGEPREKGQRP